MVNSTLKHALRAGSAPVVLALAMFSGSAMAQETTLGSQSSQAQTTAQSEEARAAAGLATSTGPSEDIVITGSRIVSPTITSVSPVQVVSDVAIDQAGVTNIQELLLESPVFGAPGLSRTNSAFLTSGTGVATVDLRNLGSDRTLVLINGRRVVSGLPGSATVDTNVIPVQFIQRIDVLTGGASSLYGSDAVAGVVNFIYKDDFEGVEANAQYGLTERGDDRRYQANITAGGNFGDGRGNAMVHFGYSNEGGVLSRNREGTFLDDIDTFAGITGDPADFGVPTQPFLSGFAPQGRFITSGGSFTFNRNNQLITGFSSNGTATRAPDGFNRQFFRTIAVPVERYLFAARVNYEVTDGISVFGEGTYNNTSSSREIEPFPLSSNGIGGIFPDATGAVPLQTLVNGVLIRNPFVPDAIFNASTDTNGDGIRDLQFARRLSEFGTRNGSTTRDFYRFVVGVEGTLFDDKFNWDLSYNYGRTSESQQSNGQVNVLNFRNALSAIPRSALGAQFAGDNTPVCADAGARAQGCVPINIYGFNSISQAAINYIAADQTFQTRISQQVVQGNLSGVLFDLPGGPLGIAVGAEYRRETSNENNDALTNAGLNAGNALPDTSGAFEVSELYGEINVPLISEGFINYLGLRGSGRVSDYSTIGTVYSYSGGVEFAPIEAIRFTGTYARSVRAPNIGELFTGPSQTFPTGLQDPCVGIGATGGGTRGDICRASPGVLGNIAANGVFTLNQADIQGISGFNSGNPNLQEEKSDSYTASVTINPRSVDFLRNVVLRVDYFNINIDDAIVTPGRAFILDQCFNQNNQDLCSFISRRPNATAINSSGSIELINVGAINGGEFSTEGLDVTLTNSIPLEGIGVGGNLNARVVYTHVFSLDTVPLPGADVDPSAGEVGAAKDRFTASLGYSNDEFTLNFTGTYLGRSSLDDQFLAGYDLEPGAIKIPAEFYLDAQASWRASDNYEFYIGADNLLDNGAPLILSGVSGNTTGTDTNASVYDVFGRRFYAGARLRF
ncbi:outer membrane receptor protein involved in Fe transport [Sphingomonas jejuensis]|uniref:Outer membrane receptor protein involved in Fe transport n=1 Tax=Sphingomonas jejuensis TaxID=904715 RepID=A0ABX0XMS7_9SPHN|nr:TonB-dependent receptor [Sphingomonas jejuensis]NJC34545.1 outer membrane receptor protein involved in Fe transport [Sphingomonas jejuensis]